MKSGDRICYKAASLTNSKSCFLSLSLSLSHISVNFFPLSLSFLSLSSLFFVFFPKSSSPSAIVINPSLFPLSLPNLDPFPYPDLGDSSPPFTMEVAVPVTPVDFNFDSACSSPYMTAPSSPQRFGTFFFSSAPTSPSRAAAFYYDFHEFGSGYGDDGGGRSSSASEIPLLWEEIPGIVKSGGDDCSSVADEDFEFDFSGQLERTSLSAEELFDCGKIRALKPSLCHRMADSVSSNVTSQISTRSSKIEQVRQKLIAESRIELCF